MAFLKVELGNTSARLFNLDADTLVLGRHPNSDIVLDNVAVSRHHAQFTREGEQYYVEDLRSRNGTVVNGSVIPERTLLQDRDRIQICDVVFRFLIELPEDSDSFGAGALGFVGPIPPQIRETPADLVESSDDVNLMSPGEVIESDSASDIDSSVIITKLRADGSGSSWRLGVKPALKLKAILELSQHLTRTLSLPHALDRILEAMFRLFPQAEEGFIVLREREDDKDTVRVRATRIRNALPEESDSVHVSMTIVRTAMQQQQAILSSDASQDSRFDMSESLVQFQIRSMMCVPIVTKEVRTYMGQVKEESQTLGVIQLSTRELSRQFSEEDLDIMVSVTAQAALAIDNVQLHDRLIHQRDIERDLELSREIQESFLPRSFPRFPGYEVGSYYQAAQNVGGDYFDYIGMPDGRLAITLADVAGKGIPAALFMARLCSIARYHITRTGSPREALMALNGDFANDDVAARMITMIVVTIDSELNTVTVASAGHPAVLIRDPDGNVETFGERSTGIPLGISTNQNINEFTTTLEPGAAFLIFSDGISEAMNHKNELYGVKRIREYFAKSKETPPELVNGIISDTHRFAEGRDQRDDMCMVCVQRTKSS